MLTRIGTFPASSLNIGLAALPAGIAAQISILGIEVSKLTAALALQAQMTVSFPPNIPSYIAAFGASLNPANLTSIFSPTTWLTANADILPEIAIELGLIEAQLAIVAGLTADIRAGLTAPGIAGWTYAGKASGFGEHLRNQTQGGFAGVDPSRNVSAVIIGSEDFAGWQGFSEGMDTGGSASKDLGQRPQESQLLYHGARSGGSWSPALDAGIAPLDLLELQLEGSKAALGVQAEVALGLDLPDVTAVVDAGLEVDLGVALENLVNVQLDLGTQISGVNAKIDALVQLSADITASLSAGGLVLWSYNGPAGQLGASLVPETQQGIPGSNDGPNGPAYGLVLAGASPEAWASFGKIFKTS